MSVTTGHLRVSQGRGHNFGKKWCQNFGNRHARLPTRTVIDRACPSSSSCGLARAGGGGRSSGEQDGGPAVASGRVMARRSALLRRPMGGHVRPMSARRAQSAVGTPRPAPRACRSGSRPRTEVRARKAACFPGSERGDGWPPPPIPPPPSQEGVGGRFHRRAWSPRRALIDTQGSGLGALLRFSQTPRTPAPLAPR